MFKFNLLETLIGVLISDPPILKFIDNVKLLLKTC